MSESRGVELVEVEVLRRALKAHPACFTPESPLANGGQCDILTKHRFKETWVRAKVCSENTAAVGDGNPKNNPRWRWVLERPEFVPESP